MFKLLLREDNGSSGPSFILSHLDLPQRSWKVLADATKSPPKEWCERRHRFPPGRETPVRGQVLFFTFFLLSFLQNEPKKTRGGVA